MSIGSKPGEKRGVATYETWLARLATHARYVETKGKT